MTKLNYTVVVVGGGPAGATVCRELNRFAIDNILIERDLLFQKPCGGGVILNAYNEFDIPKSLIQKKINSIEIISPKLNRATIDISNSPLTIINRLKFDSTLRNLANKGGTKIIEAKVYDIDVKTTPRVFAKSKKEEFEIETKYIVASDGVQSTIRKKLLNQIPNRILTYYMNIKNVYQDSCQFWFGDDISPQHYSWIFPHNDGINIGVACDKKNIRDYFQNFLKKSKLDNSNGKIKGYYIPIWENPIFFNKGVFFVGDSASMVLPFTYEGIYYAMKSATIVAKAIERDTPSLYQKEWEELFLKRFKFLKILQTLFLRNNYFSNKLVELYQKPSFQHSAIQYWLGKKEPTGEIQTVWKFLKALFK
jgi:geranylgeranyl reductase